MKLITTSTIKFINEKMIIITIIMMMMMMIVLAKQLVLKLKLAADEMT